MLEEGTYASMRDLAAAERISPTYISRLLRLTLLSPLVVEAVLDGRYAEVISWVWASQPIPEVWEKQTSCSEVANPPQC